MGLFDSWRRRRKTGTAERARIKSREILVSDSAPTTAPAPPTELPPETQAEVVSLVAEYERLVRRRDELQRERSQLTIRLDNGELSPIEFRKELMARIQEAASVAERIKEVSSRLIALGYRGILR
ncbi:MAG: hypothetical protein ACTSYX_10060 [Candidatus Thorarchaeota archaeon]